MNTQTNQTLHLPLLSGGIAVLLLGGIAIASLAITAQGFDGVFMPAKLSEATAVPAGAAPAARAPRCAECGVIESARKIETPDELIRVHAPDRIAAGHPDGIEGKPAGTYAITIRLQDGSRRVITDANPAIWRPGERVTVIAGMQ